jgi:hypothetical protein
VVVDNKYIEKTTTIITETNVEHVVIEDAVDLDLEYVSTKGMAKMAAASMPSNRYIEISPGSSGSTYIAPANGYLNIVTQASSAPAQGKLENKSSSLITQWIIPIDHYYCAAFMPCRAGEGVQYTYYYQSITRLTFHYCNDR